jgi:catechol 2,3-dioxygenase-like lactoylglutathione lyase family enzyme
MLALVKTIREDIMTLRTWYIAMLAGVVAVSVGYASAAPKRPAITGVSHLAVYAADPAASEKFYTHALGAVKTADPENPAGVRYAFSDKQFVEILPRPDASINRLDHIAFVTADAEALRGYLASRNQAVPKAISTGMDGSRYFSLLDPEGNRVEFVQPPASLSPVAANPVSGHIIHVGLIIHDRARADAFYREVLGFKPYWYGGFEEDKPTWISLQVPDGTDWIEYMVVAPADGRGIPPGMGQKTAGILNHFALGVPDIRQTYTRLWNEKRLEGQEELPKIGRDAKWQLNLYDPDGTRAEIMELKAVGQPCCSPFTASDPVE